MKKKDIVYFARFVDLGIYELTIRTVFNDFFVGVDKDTGIAYLFSPNDIGKCVFYDRNDALKTIGVFEEIWESAFKNGDDEY